jgi:hypothetical protein
MSNGTEVNLNDIQSFSTFDKAYDYAMSSRIMYFDIIEDIVDLK